MKEEHLAKSNQVRITIETKISDCRPATIAITGYIELKLIRDL